MPNDLNLVLRLTADNKGFVGEVRVSEKEVKKLTGTVREGMKAAESQTRSSDRLAAGLSRSGRETTRHVSASARLATGMRRAGNAQRAQANAARAQARAQARATAATNRAARANQRVSRSFIEAHGRTLLYVSGLLGLHQVLRATGATLAAADSYTELNNRLRLVTRSEAGLVAVRQQLLAVSQDTRTELAANASLYSRIALSAEATGHSQAQLLRVTELLNKQVLIGGNNASEAAAGLVQFAQGLASGRLQGDELRSVMENLLGVQQGLLIGFRVLRQRGQIDFDVTRANIRELAAEGVLSAELLIEAILASGDDTERKFGQVAITIEGGMKRVGNAALQTVGDLDAASGASARVGAALETIADRISEVDAAELADDLHDIGQVALFIAGVVGGRLALATAGYAIRQLRASKALSAFSRHARIGAARAALLSARQGVGAAAADRHARAILRTGAAARVLGGGLAILGGPIGIAALAAYGLYEFATASREVSDDLAGLPEQVGDLREALIGLNQAELSLTASRLFDDITRIRNEIDQARSEAARQADLLDLDTLDGGQNQSYRLRQLQQATERLAAAENRLNKLLLQEAEVRRQIAGLNTPGDASVIAQKTEDRAKRSKKLREDLLSDEQQINNVYRARIELLDEEAAADAAALVLMTPRHVKLTDALGKLNRRQLRLGRLRINERRSPGESRENKREQQSFQWRLDVGHQLPASWGPRQSAVRASQTAPLYFGSSK